MNARWMLLRGLTRGNGHWGNFPDLLKNAGVDVELMEIPGNGTTCKEKTPLAVAEVIASIKSRSRFCQDGLPFHLCGISLGGMVALAWAEAFPKDLNSVAAINTSLCQYSVFFRRLMPSNYLKIASAIFDSQPMSREQKILKTVCNHPEHSNSYVQQFAEFSEKHPVTLENLFRQLLLANRISIKSPLTVPLKIIVSKSDRLVHSSCSLQIAKNLGVKPLIHADAGHDLPLEAPEWLRQSLLETQ